MFKNIGEFIRLISVIIACFTHTVPKALGAVDDLVDAGKNQTLMIKEASEFDVRKKRAELQYDLDLFMASQQSIPKIS